MVGYRTQWFIQLLQQELDHQYLGTILPASEDIDGFGHGSNYNPEA